MHMTKWERVCLAHANSCTTCRPQESYSTSCAMPRNTSEATTLLCTTSDGPDPQRRPLLTGIVVSSSKPITITQTVVTPSDRNCTSCRGHRHVPWHNETNKVCTPRNPARKIHFRPGGTIDKHRAVPLHAPRPPRSKTNPSVISGNLALPCRGGCGGRQAKSIFKIRKLGFPLLRGEEGIQRSSYRRSPGPIHVEHKTSCRNGWQKRNRPKSATRTSLGRPPPGRPPDIYTADREQSHIKRI